MKHKKIKEKKLSKHKLEDIENYLIKNALGSALALFILRGIRKPPSKLIKELIGLERELGQFIGKTLELRSNNEEFISLENVLPGVFSYIPFQSINKFKPKGSPNEK